MEQVEHMTPLEGARDTASSTEIGGQSISWRRRGESIGQQALAEIPYGETAGSPQFKRARLEEPLENEHEKTGEDETERIGHEDIPMTKGQGEQNSSTASSFLDTRQYDREISFHQLPEGDVPLYQEAERVLVGRKGDTRTSQIHSPIEAAKIHQQVPRERRLHSRFAHRNKNAGLLDPARNPLPVIAKARFVVQGQHCPDNAQGLVRTDAPTAHRTAVSVCLQNCVINGMVAESQVCGRVVCFSARKTTRS